MTETKKKGRGRPKGAPNKPKLELVISSLKQLTTRTKLCLEKGVRVSFSAQI